ncbi:MAG: methyltransferase [Rhodospirillales bacterium CG15_BIG_FIL_POST_REV_8_21_14_020_66_15]|nr:MAG: methyltransferase [Rhodospirillales bacterium CG15_BIG_FIL_POST_REV_8_21_14_020_66_15]
MTGASAIIADETRLLDGRVICFQPAKGYRSAIDPILLQAAVPARPGEHVLELGCGAGAAALCLARRLPDVCVLGLDVQAPLIALAGRSALANGLEARVRFVAGDLLDPPAAVRAGAFDHVMANPPFRKAGTSRPSPDPVKAQATVEGRAKLADWIRAAAGLVRDGGTVTVIHHGGRGDELAELMAGSLGGLTVLPFLSQIGETRPGRVIVQGTRGAARGQETLPPFVLHESGGAYTPGVDEILRGYADLAPNFA